MKPTEIEPDLITAEIRFYNPEKKDMILVWGINGWQNVPEEQRPAGTKLNSCRMMETPMTQEGVNAMVRIQIPRKTNISYGFITDGVWQTATTQDCIIDFWTEQNTP